MKEMDKAYMLPTSLWNPRRQAPLLKKTERELSQIKTFGFFISKTTLLTYVQPPGIRFPPLSARAVAKIILIPLIPVP